MFGYKVNFITDKILDADPIDIDPINVEAVEPVAKETNNNNIKPKNQIAGVSDETLGKINAEFKQKSDTTNAEINKNNSAENFKNVASNKNLVDPRAYITLGKSFNTPAAVTQADAYLKKQLSQIQRGKTSYTDQIKDMMSQIQNRDAFEYDADSDQLFQQALASAMKSGKSAMQDTIGQASALTGGYGSTYATSAGNQAYNAFIEDAYNNLPEYYQMALNAYQMEGEEMYRQLGMLNDADATEYGRLLDSYNATSQYRNQLYNEAYTQFRDKKSDAYNTANLQLNEKTQLTDNAYKMYLVDLNEYENAYARDWNEWNASVQNAYQTAGLEQNAYQYQTSFDYQKDRDAVADSQWQQSFDESVRQYNQSFTESQRQFNAQQDLAERQFAYQKSKGSGSGGSGGGGLGDFVNEIEAQKAMESASNSPAVKKFRANVLTYDEFSRRGNSATLGGNQKRYDSYAQYIEDHIDEAVKKGNITEHEAAYLYALEW